MGTGLTAKKISFWGHISQQKMYTHLQTITFIAQRKQLKNQGNFGFAAPLIYCIGKIEDFDYTTRLSDLGCAMKRETFLAHVSSKTFAFS